MKTKEIFVEIDKDELLHQALDEFEDFRIYILESTAYSNLPEFKDALSDSAKQFDSPEFRQRVQTFLSRARALREALMAQPTTGQFTS